MRAGEHVRMVRVRDGSKIGKGILLGVAEKPGRTVSRDDNRRHVYAWENAGCKTIPGETYHNALEAWENNDTLHFRLNCTNHALTITNTRSGETDTITDLPLTGL